MGMFGDPDLDPEEKAEMVSLTFSYGNGLIHAIIIEYLIGNANNGAVVAEAAGLLRSMELTGIDLEDARADYPQFAGWLANQMEMAQGVLLANFQQLHQRFA